MVPLIKQRSLRFPGLGSYFSWILIQIQKLLCEIYFNKGSELRVIGVTDTQEFLLEFRISLSQ